MERVEKTLEALMPTFESHGIGSWGSSEVALLCAMVKEYGVQARAKESGNAPAAESSCENEEDEESVEDEEMDDEAMFVEAVGEVDRGLGLVREFLKSRLPFGAIAEPTLVPGTTKTTAAPRKRSRSLEKADAPSGVGSATGSAVVPAPVYAVDAFLYSEADIEALVAAKQLAREYCTRCGCTEIGLAEFITHSFSTDQLVYLSCFLFPHVLRQFWETHKEEEAPLRIVDVGSRLGIVLWASAFALQQGALIQPPPLDSEGDGDDGDDEEDEEESEPEVEIVGVEVDAAYVKLSQEVVRRFFAPRKRRAPKLNSNNARANEAVREPEDAEEPMDVSSQIRLVQSDCFAEAGAEVLARASVVVLHNVFEYFCASSVEHARCWLKLRRLVHRRGQFLICSPAVEETLAGFSGEVWVRACEVEGEKSPTAVAPASPESWLASYVERVDVAEVANRFLDLRALSREEGEGEKVDMGCEKMCCNTEEEKDYEGHEGACCDHEHEHEHEHSHSHGHHHHHGHARDYHKEDASEASEQHDDEASEVEEQVQKIFVYRVL